MDNKMLFSLMEDAQFVDIMNIDIVQEGYWKQLGWGMKNILGNLKDGGSPLYTGNFSGLQSRLLGFVKSCKSVNDCNYLLNDARSAKTMINKLKDNLTKYINKDPNAKINKKDMEKRVKMGLTPAKIDSYLKWIDNTYIPAIKKKKAELK